MKAMLRAGLVAFAGACGSGNSDTRPIEAAAFEVVDPEVDLGVVPVGLEQQVRFRAMVGMAVELRDISRSCACASAAIEGLAVPIEILPGASVRVAPGELQIALRFSIDRPGHGSVELGGLAWAGSKASRWGVRVSYSAEPVLVYDRRRVSELSGGAWVEIHTLSRTDDIPIRLRLGEKLTIPQLPADAMLIGGCEVERAAGCVTLLVDGCGANAGLFPCLDVWTWSGGRAVPIGLWRLPIGRPPDRPPLPGSAGSRQD